MYALVTVALLLRTRPGRVGIDTKQYLYLDPGRFLGDAWKMWNPGTAFGSVPHQSVGFLWPMGPFFWVGEELGLPDWATQRLWLAGLLVAAGLGVLAAARALGFTGAGAWTAALVFAWSPYTLGYVHRTSVLLLPWAALGWLLLFAIRSVRRGGWRDPAAFALVALTVGGPNATAFLLVGLGPALWVAMAALDRSIGWRRAVGAGLKIGALTAGASLWWFVALVVQGRYSLNVLHYSETLDAVARSTSAAEVLRGLGYWLFYGRDRLEAWIEPAPAYQQSVRLLLVSFAVPTLGIIALGLIRWRQRAYAAALVILGLTLATGAYPWEAPSRLGSLFKALATSSDVGLALRSSSRAVPLLVLGLALATGAGINALGGRSTARAWAAAGVTAAIALAAFTPLWRGTLVAQNLSRPEKIPDAWSDAAAWLDARPHDTRILAIPGIDLTFHRWGAVWEPVTPGLTDRPFAARELIPYGGPGSVDLLMALDRRMQEGTFDPATVAPIARLLGVGDVVLRSDLQYERYRTPRPDALWARLEQDHPGLAVPVEFGPPAPNHAGPQLPLLDEVDLRTADGSEDPPAVAAFSVEAARPLLHTASTTGALVVSGSGDGVVDAAAAGLVQQPGLLVYSASLAHRPQDLADLLGSGADVLVTDSNRRRALRWRTLRDNAGYTEAAGEQPLVDDLSDARLDLFPRAGDDARSVTVTEGARARATAYGNPVTYTADVRPQLAVDGDPATAWRVGTFGDPRHERLVIDLEKPTALGSIHLTQDRRPGSNAITEVRIELDGRPTGAVRLDERSWSGAGQEISLPRGDASEISIEILGVEHDPGTPGIDPSVGIAEIAIPGVTATEAVRLPTDLLAALGPSLDHRLVLSMARLRSDPAEVVRTDDEASIRRIVEIPARRSFSLAATARLSARADDQVLATALGVVGPSMTASDSLGGDLRSRPWAAHDGDPATRWQPGFGDQSGRWLQVDLGREITLDHLDLDVVADGRHSVPTRVTIELDGVARSLDLPPVTDSAAAGATVEVPVDFEAMTGSRLRLTVDAVRERRTRDWYSLTDVTTPVGIAELGIPGASLTRLPDRLPSACRDDLLQIDGQPVALRLDGEVAAALDRTGIELRPCTATDEVTLGAGSRFIASTAGATTAIDVDALVLASAAGGSAAAEPRAPLGQQPVTGPRPIEVIESAATRYRATVAPGSDKSVLVLGQNLNEGWHASADGKDLGPPTLVDGYANGWVLPASDRPTDVRLTWVPQRYAWWGFLGSALTAVLCLSILVAATRRRSAAVLRRPAAAPVVALPWTTSPRLSWGRSGTAVAAVGGFALLASTPLVAAVVVAGTALAARWPRGRLATIGGGALCVVTAVGHIVVSQRRHAWAADFDWPTHFELSHQLVWCGVLLVVADVVVDALRTSGAGSTATTTVGDAHE